MHDQPVIIKKKKAHGHKHHGGSWKVAYADFVTAMMAFFMVMWILGMSDQDKSVIAQYFTDPVGFAKTAPAQKMNIAPIRGEPAMMNDAKSHKEGSDPKNEDERRMRSIEGAIKDALNRSPDISELMKQVEVTLVREGLRIELVEKEHSTFFDSGRATLLPAGQKFVTKLAPFIRDAGHQVVIEGHTDAEPYPGSGYDNWNLSADRAETVRRALQAGGVAAKQFSGIFGYADRKLKDSQHPYSSVNRRVTILLPFSEKVNLAPPPAKDELKSEIHEQFKKPGPDGVQIKP